MISRRTLLKAFVVAPVLFRPRHASGVHMPELFRAAKSFSSGGVGLYREFVHIDVGPVRYWSQGK